MLVDQKDRIGEQLRSALDESPSCKQKALASVEPSPRYKPSGLADGRATIEPQPHPAPISACSALGHVAHLLLLGRRALDEALALVVGLADAVDGVDLLGL